MLRLAKHASVTDVTIAHVQNVFERVVPATAPFFGTLRRTHEGHSRDPVAVAACGSKAARAS